MTKSTSGSAPSCETTSDATHPNTNWIQRARESLSDACTATDQASRTALHAHLAAELNALHLHLVLIDRQLGLIQRTAGIVSRRRV
jgi:hypothetical protein